MAGDTTGGDASVIHRRAGERGEVSDRVAGLTGQTGRHVNRGCSIFEHRLQVTLISRRSTVAARTTAEDAGVIHRRAGEGGEISNRVAGLTGQSGREVTRLFVYRQRR